MHLSELIELPTVHVAQELEAGRLVDLTHFGWEHSLPRLFVSEDIFRQHLADAQAPDAGLPDVQRTEAFAKDVAFWGGVMSRRARSSWTFILERPVAGAQVQLLPVTLQRVRDADEHGQVCLLVLPFKP